MMRRKARLSDGYRRDAIVQRLLDWIDEAETAGRTRRANELEEIAWSVVAIGMGPPFLEERPERAVEGARPAYWQSTVNHILI
jgi:hypothetical protein